MTALVQNTALTNTMEFLINRVNELAYAMSTLAVTADSNTAAGNASISGTFSANSINASSFTATTFTTNSVSVGIGGVVAFAYTTNGTSAQQVDYVNTSSYSAVEYVIRVNDNVANNKYASKILLLYDGASALVTEYAAITTNSVIGTFSANANSSAVRLFFTPSSSNTTVRMIRTSI